MFRAMLSFFILFSFQTFSLAEDHGSESTGAKSSGGRRLKTDGKLSEEAAQFLSSHFYKPIEIIRKDYDTAIPEAIEKAIQNKDETAIGQILGDLIATTNPTQAEAVIKDAKKEIQEETEGKDPAKYDTRYVALMERIVWAGMNRIGDKAIGEEKNAKEFNQAFKDPYKNAMAFNQTANEKLKQAAGGDAKAKEWVNNNIRKSTILSLAEGQRKTGNKKLSDIMVKGVAFDVKGSDGKTQKALDMWGPGGEPQRLYLGSTDASATQAIDAFLNEKKTFGPNAAAAKELPNDGNLKSWYADSSGLQKGSPQGFEPKVEERRDTSSKDSDGTPVTFESLKADLEGAIAKHNCTSCHGLEVRGSSLAELGLYQAKTGEIKLSDFADRFTNHTDDYMYGIMSPEQKAQFAEFARLQREGK